MAVAKLTGLVDRLRRLAGPPAADGPGDGPLLRRFVAAADAAAFEALVRRHGPMVLGVCRRVLNDPHAAEDAFQATFVVLVRRAGAIARPERLGSWLYGVAYRTALRARADAARRRQRERRAAAMEPTEGLDAHADADLRPVLDEELGRLPAKLRDPVVLCYLEGLTTDEAARRLGWPRGTVAGRLAQAKGLLRGRLTRRGLAPASVALAATLPAHVARAAVPAPLVASTVQAALAVAAGHSAAAALSVPTAALVQGVLRTMYLTKLKITLAVLLGIGLTGAGATALALRAPAAAGNNVAAADDEDAPRPKPRRETPPSDDEDTPRPKPRRVTPPTDDEDAPRAKPRRATSPAEDDDAGDQQRLQGTWVGVGGERDGKPATREQLRTFRFVIKGNRISAGGRTMKFHLDAEASPRTITMTPVGGEDKRRTVDGIYALEGGRLKLCFADDEKAERPTAFAAPAGSGLALIVLRRATEKEAAAEPPAGDSPAARALTSNRIRQIGIAFHNYADNNRGRLPPAAIHNKDGKPLLSWRVLLLPYLEQDALYRAFKLDEPWDSPHNKRLLAQRPQVYAPAGGRHAEGDGTLFQVFVGKGTCFEGRKGIRFPADIPDGTSNTILAVEAGEPVPWTKPADLPYRADQPLPALGASRAGFWALLADGSSHFVRRPFNADKLRPFITRNDGEVVDFESLK